MPAFGSLLTAVDTNTRSPQTIGLETATPGIGVFQRTFSLAGAFQVTGVGLPSATPAAFGAAEGRPVLRRERHASWQSTRRRQARVASTFPPRACSSWSIRPG